jgi:hypothetical protein
MIDTNGLHQIDDRQRTSKHREEQCREEPHVGGNRPPAKRVDALRIVKSSKRVPRMSARSFAISSLLMSASYIGVRAVPTNGRNWRLMRSHRKGDFWCDSGHRYFGAFAPEPVVPEPPPACDDRLKTDIRSGFLHRPSS